MYLRYTIPRVTLTITIVYLVLLEVTAAVTHRFSGELSPFRPCTFNLKQFPSKAHHHSQSATHLLNSVIQINQAPTQTWRILNTSTPMTFKLEYSDIGPGPSKSPHPPCSLFMYINPPNYESLHSSMKIMPLVANLEWVTFLLIRLFPSPGHQGQESPLNLYPNLNEEDDKTFPETDPWDLSYLVVFSYWNALVLSVHVQGPDFDLLPPSYFYLCSHCPLESRIKELRCEERSGSGTETSCFQDARDAWTIDNRNFNGHIFPFFKSHKHDLHGLDYSDCTNPLRVPIRLLRKCLPNFYKTELLRSGLNMTLQYESDPKIYYESHSLQFPFMLGIHYFGDLAFLFRLIFPEEQVQMTPIYCQPFEEHKFMTKSPLDLLELLEPRTWLITILTFGWSGFFLAPSQSRIKIGPFITLGLLLGKEWEGPMSRSRGVPGLKLLLSLTAIIISTGWEGKFTSWVISPPPPRILQDLTDLLDNNYKIYTRFRANQPQRSVTSSLQSLYEKEFNRSGNEWRRNASFYVDKTPLDYWTQPDKEPSLFWRRLDLAANGSSRAKEGRIAILTRAPEKAVVLLNYAFPESSCYAVRGVDIRVRVPIFNFHFRYAHVFMRFVTRMGAGGFMNLFEGVVVWLHSLAILPLRTSTTTTTPTNLTLLGGTKPIFELYGLSVLVAIMGLVIELVFFVVQPCHRVHIHGLFYP